MYVCTIMINKNWLLTTVVLISGLTIGVVTPLLQLQGHVWAGEVVSSMLLLAKQWRRQQAFTGGGQGDSCGGQLVLPIVPTLGPRQKFNKYIPNTLYDECMLKISQTHTTYRLQQTDLPTSQASMRQ